MSLKSFFAWMVIGLLAIELILMGASLYFVTNSSNQVYHKAELRDFQRIFDLNRVELVGNILLDHNHLTRKFLSGIATAENVDITLKVDGAEIVAGNTLTGNIVSRSFAINHLGEKLGEITFRRKRPSVFAGIKDILAAFVVMQLFLILGLAALVFFLVSRFILKPFTSLVKQARSGDINTSEFPPGSMPKEIRHLFEILQKLWSDYKSRTKEASVGAISAQVAHDIRSPLTALRMLLGAMSELPEDKRVLMRSSVNRLEDIANVLLGQWRKSDQRIVKDDGDTSTSRQLLSVIIDAIVTEKRLQYRSRRLIQIETSYEEHSYGLFAQINPSAFKRMLSNLINNAVEALPRGSGRVDVTLASTDKEVILKVCDTGRGMTPEIVRRVGEKGFTYDKHGGSGLGLYHAIQQVESWGGKLTIDSTPKVGTVVEIVLSKAETPNWFVPGLIFSADSTVAVLDDDESIHQTWESKFDHVGLSQPLLHFTNTQGISDWISLQSNLDNVTILCDYELVGEELTGIDFIIQNGLENQAVLVTSRFEEPEVLSKCEELGVRLLPKSLVTLVPIEIGDIVTKPDAVLIDDDALVRSAWAQSGQQFNVSVTCFKNVSEFLRVSHLFSKRVPVYIDDQLNEKTRGAMLAREIHKRNFRTIYLATGHRPEDIELAEFPWLRSVVGKQPPWSVASDVIS